MLEHTHKDATCPTRNPDMVRALAGHVTDENAAKFGVRIVADFVRDVDHNVIIVLEAPSPDKAAAFASPFIMVGPVTIKQGETCEQVAKACLGQA
jgi:hypothetical protein